MPHYQLDVIHPLGEYPAYIEAESPEAATEKYFSDMTEKERARNYRVETVTERQPLLGYTLVMGGDGIYGKYGPGPTLAEAKKEFRRCGGRLGLGYSVLTFDAKTDFLGVDQMGRYHYIGNAPEIEEVKPR